MIGIGGFIMIVCICGCYGIVKEYRYLFILVSSIFKFVDIYLQNIIMCLVCILWIDWCIFLSFFCYFLWYEGIKSIFMFLRGDVS